MTPPITLSFPAHSAHVSLARHVAAALAARMEFTIDQVEDVRLAIDEACSHLITGGDEVVTCLFMVDGNGLTMIETSDAAQSPLPDPNGFGWIVMRALVDEVTAADDHGRVTITLRIRGLEPAGA